MSSDPNTKPENNLEHAITKLQTHPWLSATILASGAAGLASDGMLPIVVGIASPLLMLRETAAGTINLFRERSLLSKTFSSVATVSGVAAGAIALNKMNTSGAEALAMYFATYAGMMVSSAANIAAQYTRNIGPTRVKFENTNTPQPPLPD